MGDVRPIWTAPSVTEAERARHLEFAEALEGRPSDVPLGPDLPPAFELADAVVYGARVMLERFGASERSPHPSLRIRCGRRLASSSSARPRSQKTSGRPRSVTGS